MRTSYLLSQRIRYDYTAAVTDVRQRLVVVPPVRHGPQRRHTWSLAVEGAGSARRHVRRDSFGNLVLDIVVRDVCESLTFVVDASVTRDCADGTCGAVHRTRVDPRYLEPTRLTDHRNRAVAMVAKDAPDVATIASRVHESLAYEWGITGVRTSARQALALGRGVCQDYAHVMIAACRSLGIAARYVSGHLAGEGGSHAWVEVLVPDPKREGLAVVEAWDPTHDRRAGRGYLTVAVGRDYSDVAPMSGTYEGRGRGSLTVEKRLTAA